MEKAVHIVRNINAFTSEMDGILADEFTFECKVLENTIQESNHFISKALDISIASKIFCFKRLIIVENKPRAIETLYIDYNKVPGIENINLKNESLYAILRNKYKIETNQNEEEILVVDANDNEMKMLNLKKDAEILLIKGTTYINKHEPFIYFEMITLTDFYVFRSTMNL